MTSVYITRDSHGNHTTYSIGLPANKDISASNGKEAIIEYLAEGGANIVYHIRRKTPQLVSRKLLRVRKDRPFIQATMKQFEAFEEHFSALFPKENLIEQLPIRLEPEFIAALNSDLGRIEASRKRLNQWHGDRLAEDETFGMLITDMTAGLDEYVVDMKPKWLTQSPNAPVGATRCRTCALRAQRKAHTNKKHAGSADFCPLTLVANDERTRAEAAMAVIKSQGGSIPSDVESNIIHYLAGEGYKLLNKLRQHQAALDTTGILSVNLESTIPDDYLKAMTLRDCSLFVKGSTKDFQTFEARLADLDLKHPHPDKVAYWKATEQRLIDGGWYNNTEENPVPESICLLARAREV